jgi:hypothetical protein
VTGVQRIGVRTKVEVCHQAILLDLAWVRSARAAFRKVFCCLAGRLVQWGFRVNWDIAALHYFLVTNFQFLLLGDAGRQKALPLGWKLAIHFERSRTLREASGGRPASTPSAEAGLSFLSSINRGAVQGDGISIHYSMKFLAVVHNHKMHRDRTREYCWSGAIRIHNVGSAVRPPFLHGGHAVEDDVVNGGHVPAAVKVDHGQSTQRPIRGKEDTFD